MRSPRAGPGRRRSTGSWDPRTRSRSSASWSGTPAPSSRVTARPRGHLGMLAARPRPPRPLTAAPSPRPPARKEGTGTRRRRPRPALPLSPHRPSRRASGTRTVRRCPHGGRSRCSTAWALLHLRPPRGRTRGRRRRGRCRCSPIRVSIRQRISPVTPRPSPVRQLRHRWEQWRDRWQPAPGGRRSARATLPDVPGSCPSGRRSRCVTR